MKRIFAAIMALVLIALNLPAALAKGEKAVTLHFITRGVTLSGDEDNMVKQAIEEKFNCRIYWEVLPSTNYNTAAQGILASGDYPDLLEYSLVSVEELEGFIEDGILLPLNGLLEEHGQNILKDRPLDRNWYFYEDGERYAIPCRFTNQPETFYTIRQDWLDALELDMPTTLDELVEVAYQFTYNDPDGNGEDDTYGFGCALEGHYYDALYIFLGAFGVVRDWMRQEDGTYLPWQLTDGCREAIRYFKENVYQKGLVDPNFMIMSRNEYLENKYQDRYGIEYWYLTHTNSSSTWWSNFCEYVPWNETVPLKPVAAEGYTAVFPRTVSSGDPTGFNLFLFEDSEHAELVMDILNYLASDEGADLVELGVKGFNWDEIDGQYTELPLTKAELRQSGKGMYTVVFWHTMYKRNASQLTWDGLESLEGFTVDSISLPYTYDGDTSALSSLLDNRIVSMIINPDTDVDAAFETMKAEYYGMGGEKLIRWYNEQMEAYGAQ